MRTFRAEYKTEATPLKDMVENIVTMAPGKWTPGELASLFGVPITQIFTVLNENEWLKNYVRYKYKEGEALGTTA